MIDVEEKIYKITFQDAARFKKSDYQTKYEFTGKNVMDIKAAVNDPYVDSVKIDIDGDIFTINAKNLRECLLYKSLSIDNPPNELVSIIPFTCDGDFIMNYKKRN